MMDAEQKLHDHAFARKRLDTLWRFARASIPSHEESRMSHITLLAADTEHRLDEAEQRARRRQIQLIGRQP